MRTRHIFALSLATVLVAACGTPGPSRFVVAGSASAQVWGDGQYGLVLVADADAGSWQDAPATFADDGMTVLAIEDADAAAVEAGLRHLLEDVGLERAALLAAGDAAAAALAVAGEHPELVDQLILLSGTGGDVSGLTEFPKLFVASAGEAAAADAERMAEEAPGAWNELYLADSDAVGQALLRDAGVMEAVARRLDERR